MFMDQPSIAGKWPKECAKSIDAPFFTKLTWLPVAVIEPKSAFLVAAARGEHTWQRIEMALEFIAEAQKTDNY